MSGSKQTNPKPHLPKSFSLKLVRGLGNEKVTKVTQRRRQEKGGGASTVLYLGLQETDARREHLLAILGSITFVLISAVIYLFESD